MSAPVPPRERAIESFRGDYGFLSNFHTGDPIPLVGLPADCFLEEAPTAEHLFQALKSNDWTVRLYVLQALTPRIAKLRGRSIALRGDWEAVKARIMLGVVRAKFAPGGRLTAKLIATGEAHLMEGNTWGDTTWGCVWHPQRGWVGQNLLGEILGHVRTERRFACTLPNRWEGGA